MPEVLLDGKVELHCGDSLKLLKDIPNGWFDSIVTDPPYALVSIGKRFGADGAAAVKVPAGGSGAYARASAGFMGKRWDTGETAFAVEFWAQCLRVLKPGGHVVAFGGTRTYHRLACAIEDAGFEIRDQIGWCFGSGFPKSHNAGDGWGTALKPAWEPICLARKPLVGTVLGNISLHGVGALNIRATRVPTSPDGSRNNLADSMVCTCSLREASQTIRSERKHNRALSSSGPEGLGIHRASGEMRETRDPTALNFQDGYPNDRDSDGEPAQLESETAQDDPPSFYDGDTLPVRCATCGRIRGDLSMPSNNDTARNIQDQGRWPANLVHDGSEEVIAAFPDAPGQQQDIALDAPSARTGNVYGKMNRRGEKSADSRYADKGSTNFAALPGMRRGDAGSSARFFYQAKADSDDRLGSKHPTVKPVDLMQWLVRLVTPKGGLVLDPFAGTGTTAEACFREGMRCMLVEREAEYQADIRRRMSLVLGGPDERRRESIKAKMRDQPVDAGPLFTQALDI